MQGSRAALFCLVPMLAASVVAGPVRADEYDLPPDVGLAPEMGGAAASDADLPAPDAAPEAPGTLTVEARLLRAETRDGTETGSFRATAQWMGHRSFSPDLGLRYNLRVRATQVQHEDFALREDLRLDVQELALHWQARPGLAFDIGRVNLRNGVAQGYNPTDWFKADSLVTSDSADPGDRRLERLGTLMLAGQLSLGADLLSFGYRPRISASGDDLLAGQDVVGLNLHRTNPSEAVFLKYAPDTGDNLNLTVSALVEDGDPGLGMEVSAAVGQSLVLYAEGFAQRRRSLAGEGMAGGSAALRDALGADAGKGWQAQAALGGSWALPSALVGQRDISLALEYHYNGAGLSEARLDALALASGADLAAAGALRGYAARQQEPLAREQVFARMAWNDLWKDADLSVLAFYVPADHSGLWQASIAMPFHDDKAELSLRASRSFGDSASAYGANPVETTAQIAVRYTF